MSIIFPVADWLSMRSHSDMEQNESERKWDVVQVMSALKRVSQNWPSDRDIAECWNKGSLFFAFESPEEASAAVAALHQRDSRENAVANISYALRTEAIEGFIAQHIQSAASVDKAGVEMAIERMVVRGSFFPLEQFLSDVSELGAEKALRKLRHVDRGGKVGHVFAGFLSLLELTVVVMVLSACEKGFQTIVLAVLGLIYSAVLFQAQAASNFNARRFAAVQQESIRVRAVLRDKSLNWAETEEEFHELSSVFARNEVRYWIMCGKLALIDVICIGSLITTIF